MKSIDIIKDYASLSLKKLPENIRKNGFDYKLIKRTNEKLIYAQYSKSGICIGYEFFKNKIKPWRKVKEMWAKKQNDKTDFSNEAEYTEVFPGDEDFGKRAWNYKTLEQAMLAFDTK